MTPHPSPPPAAAAVLYVIVTLAALSYPFAAALGSGATIAIASDSTTVCGIVSSEPTQSIRCYRPATGQTLNLAPNTSFSLISGGATDLCGLRHGGGAFFCWNWSALFSNSSVPNPKRVYFNDTVPLRTISVGVNHICGLVNGTGAVKCWRSGAAFSVPPDEQFVSVSSGSRFSCGILANRVRCWGSNPIGASIENGFVNIPMETIEVGGSHACGFNSSGFVICRGENQSGQLNVPFNTSPEYYTTLSLGSNHSCAIRSVNHTVVCWGLFSVTGSDENDDVSFESIVSGSNFTCGLITANLSITCWGPGWHRPAGIPLSWILPGPCVGVQTPCPCGVYALSQTLCFGSGHICSVCPHLSLNPPPPPPPLPPATPPESSPAATSSSPPRALRRGLLAFAVIGSVGILAGICTLFYWLWKRGCFGHKKIHNSVQPTITRASSNGGALSNNSPPSRSSTLRRQASRVFRRQRSGTSSFKHGEKSEEFSFQELAAATRDFCLENKIGAGSFGVVYRGTLADGRNVAIKRGEMKAKKFQEKESAFDSELAFLSRVHHKHLVRLVGFCHEAAERLLVYEFMKHGALHDHLHGGEKSSSSSSYLINTWKMRIKIALDASRGIEYLHNYAVPPIIHRDIKSSNILLDANWTARVSDFGLSLLGPDDSNNDRDMRPSKAAGTVGYIDPEYYGLNVLTVKSDVYGFGVVLLELLTGKRAIFKNGEDGGTPVSLVDYAVPAIMSGELGRILDPRVGAPEINEAEAVELVGYTAMHCVSLEGKDRPTMADIVANLERALGLCDESHGSISSGSLMELA